MYTELSLPLYIILFIVISSKLKSNLFIFAAIYFIGLLKINEGILRAYFLVSVLAGYVVYQNLMHEKMYIMIVKINQKLTRLFKPVRFVFLKFDGIIGSIKKRVKR